MAKTMCPEPAHKGVLNLVNEYARLKMVCAQSIQTIYKLLSVQGKLYKRNGGRDRRALSDGRRPGANMRD